MIVGPSLPLLVDEYRDDRSGGMNRRRAFVRFCQAVWSMVKGRLRYR